MDFSLCVWGGARPPRSLNTDSVFLLAEPWGLWGLYLSPESLPRRFLWEILDSKGPAAVPLRRWLLFIRQVVQKDTHVLPSLEKPTALLFPHLQMQNQIPLQGNVNFLRVRVNLEGACRLNESERSNTRCAMWSNQQEPLPSFFSQLWTLIYTSGRAGGGGVVSSVFESLEVLDFRVRGHANTFDKFPLVTPMLLNFEFITHASRHASHTRLAQSENSEVASTTDQSYGSRVLAWRRSDKLSVFLMSLIWRWLIC